MRWLKGTCIGMSLFFGLCIYSVGSTQPPPPMTVATRAALDAFRAELQASAGSDPIIDPDSPANADRTKRPLHRKYSPPEPPRDLRQQGGRGQAIVAGVLERDGSVQ